MKTADLQVIARGVRAVLEREREDAARRDAGLRVEIGALAGRVRALERAPASPFGAGAPAFATAGDEHDEDADLLVLDVPDDAPTFDASERTRRARDWLDAERAERFAEMLARAEPLRIRRSLGWLASSIGEPCAPRPKPRATFDFWRSANAA